MHANTTSLFDAAPSLQLCSLRTQPASPFQVSQSMVLTTVSPRAHGTSSAFRSKTQPAPSTTLPSATSSSRRQTTAARAAPASSCKTAMVACRGLRFTTARFMTFRRTALPPMKKARSPLSAETLLLASVRPMGRRRMESRSALVPPDQFSTIL